jgi:hypothetical protein
MILLQFIGLFLTTVILSFVLCCMMLGRWMLTPILGDATQDMLSMLEELRSIWQSLREIILEYFQ